MNVIIRFIFEREEKERNKKQAEIWKKQKKKENKNDDIRHVIYLCEIIKHRNIFFLLILKTIIIFSSDSHKLCNW